MGKTVISDDGRFEWDEEKNEINRKKHGFGFEAITDVLLGSFVPARQIVQSINPLCSSISSI